MRTGSELTLPKAEASALQEAARASPRSATEPGTRADAIRIRKWPVLEVNLAPNDDPSAGFKELNRGEEQRDGAAAYAFTASRVKLRPPDGGP